MEVRPRDVLHVRGPVLEAVEDASLPTGARALAAWLSQRGSAFFSSVMEAFPHQDQVQLTEWAEHLVQHGWVGVDPLAATTLAPIERMWAHAVEAAARTFESAWPWEELSEARREMLRSRASAALEAAMGPLTVMHGVYDVATAQVLGTYGEQGDAEEFARRENAEASRAAAANEAPYDPVWVVAVVPVSEP